MSPTPWGHCHASWGQQPYLTSLGLPSEASAALHSNGASFACPRGRVTCPLSCLESGNISALNLPSELFVQQVASPQGSPPMPGPQPPEILDMVISHMCSPKGLQKRGAGDRDAFTTGPRGATRTSGYLLATKMALSSPPSQLLPSAALMAVTILCT